MLPGCAGTTFGTTFGKGSAKRASQESGADPLVVSEVTISGRGFEHPASPPRELMEQLLGELSPEWQQRAAELTDAMTRLTPTTALGLARSTNQSAPPRFIVYIRDGQLSLLRLGDDLRSDRIVASVPMPGATPAKAKKAAAPAPKNDPQATASGQTDPVQPPPSGNPAPASGQDQLDTSTQPPTQPPAQPEAAQPEQAPATGQVSPGPLLQPARSDEPKT